MFEITKEESEELKIQIMQLENTKNKKMGDKLLIQQVIEKEKVLLKEYARSGALVYIIKVKTFTNGEYIVKFGHSTIGINNRYTEHKHKYDECLLLDCFEVNKSKEFESFLHSHSSIHPDKVTNLPGHEKEQELFLIGKNLTYQTLLQIIDDNINNYNYRVCELLLEIENLKLKNTGQLINNDNELLKELVTINKMLVNKVNSLETTVQQINYKINVKETKVVTGFNQQIPNLGPRIQKINPDTISIVKVYESVTEVMNENKNIKRPSIMKSIGENTIYCGFRWLLVERNLDPNIIYNIMPTKETKVQNLGYIAKLSNDKTKILNVYLDRKTAANLNGYQSPSALDNYVKNNTIVNGHYYMLYSKCDDTLIGNFEQTHNRPLLYKNGIGQYDSNLILIKEFSCKYDCAKELKISDKTLIKALTTNIPYNNFYYKELGSKLHML